MFSNLNIKNKIMSNKMIIGAFIFIGYIYGINYFLHSNFFINDDTDTESEMESEQPNVPLPTVLDDKVDKEQDIQMEEIECKENECKEIECKEIECKEIECKEIECSEKESEKTNDKDIQMEEIECSEKECESDSGIRCRKTKRNLRKLFEKKKYMIELDRELANIKDRLEDIRNNLHNFN